MSWDVESIEEAEQVEAVTPADVEAAEQDATGAEAEVTALEERVLAGDESVTADTIEKQRGLSRFARLRAQAVARKAERHKQAERLKACNALRLEIEESSAKHGPAMAAALDKAEKALTDLFRLARERNERVSAWGEEVQSLCRTEHRSPFQPDKTSAHLGWTRAELIAGRRRLARPALPVDHWVKLATQRAQAAARDANPDLTRNPMLLAAAIDAAESADPEPQVEFWKNAETGRPFMFDADKAPVNDPNMRKISRKEAERAIW
ncbi:hypothetical protein PV646_34105 [Streptomyces sp. ID05-26A]|nr:hypothetical protein [Streptomyces sp. ID05-26A]